MDTSQPTLGASLGRGALAGLAGTVVMTAFQKFIEMPITGRGDSYAPAKLAERVLPIHSRTARGRKRLNYVTHFALGLMWGAATGVAGYAGLRGAKAVSVVFGTLYTGDVLLNTALGLYKPWNWSRQDLVVDVVDKFVQAGTTGAVFDRMVARPGMHA